MELPILQSIYKKVTKNFVKKSYLGIDLGTTSIKAVEIAEEGGRPALKNYGIIESQGHLSGLGGSIKMSSSRTIDKELVSLLRLLKNKMGLKNKSVVASIPNASGFMTLIDLPEMTDKELSQAMSYQAREHIPLPVEDAVIDWNLLGTVDQDGIKSQQVLLVAIPLDIINNYREIFKEAGLELVAVELDSIALARVASINDPTPTAVADIGSKATTVLIMDQGSLRMSFNSETAGNDISQSISRSLEIENRRAQELKHTRGLAVSAGEGELGKLMMPTLDAIIGEVERAIEVYKSKHNTNVERVILSGGTACMKEIDQYFSSQMNLPVVIVSPFTRIRYTQEFKPLERGLGPKLAIATGLAIKDYI